MKDKLLIIGASGHGKVVADIALKMNQWKHIAFLDDNKDINLSLGLNIIGTLAEIESKIDEYDMFVAIGNNDIRERMYLKLEALGATIPVIKYPSAIVGSYVEIGRGTVIMPGAIINCNSKIGQASIINTGATVDHDCTIGNYSHISPGVHIAGTVSIGYKCWLGIGSIVSNNITIQNNIIIGAGSVVVKDILEPGVYVGIPATKKK